MAHSLTINGIDINFTATPTTILGKNNNSDVPNYAFIEAIEEGNNSTHQYQVITSSEAIDLTLQVNLAVGDSLNIWTSLPENNINEEVGDPVTDRGTEVVVQSGVGKD